MGKSAKDIKEITNRTHEACVRIIDKQFKPMDNFADRDHCVQVSLTVLSDHLNSVLTAIVHGCHHAGLQPIDSQ